MEQTIDPMKMELMRLEAQRLPRGMEQERASNLNRIQTLQRLIAQKTATTRTVVVTDTTPRMPGPIQAHIRPQTQNWVEMGPAKYKAHHATDAPVAANLVRESRGGVRPPRYGRAR